jgi:GNAT superfamily N-acetyltransferase
MRSAPTEGASKMTLIEHTQPGQGAASLVTHPGQDAASFSVMETLRNGRRVEIRALRPLDRGGLLAAIERISEDSLARRFFGAKRHFSEREIAYFVNIDFVTHVALVAVSEDASAIVGGARYVLVRPTWAEVAFAVVDDCQGLGLGALLLRHLTTIARRAGLRELVAEVLADNRPMLRVLERSRLPLTTRRDGAVIHATLQL